MEGAPRALLLVQHGGGWHSGYDDMGNGLAAAGFEVMAFDTAGHGWSQGPGALKEETGAKEEEVKEEGEKKGKAGKARRRVGCVEREGWTGQLAPVGREDIVS